MTDIPAMMLWTDKYLGDTTHLTTVEHGAYLLILMAMWRAGGRLPNDEIRLARTARVSIDRWRKMEASVGAFLMVENGHVTQKRLKREFEKATSRLEKLKAAGHAGGSAKALKYNNTTRSDARKMPEAESKPAPTTENWKLEEEGNLKVSCPKPAKPVRTRKAYSEEFEAFWSDYPTDNLMSKSEAGKAWDRLTEEDRELTLTSLPAFQAHCRQHPDYRPIHACRYITQRRFEGFARFVQQAESKVWIKIGTPQFDAWNAWWQDNRGRSIPQTKGGWWVPADFPPAMQVAS
jgi:uncharacterized protein YdaU (DUF1376 family)